MTVTENLTATAQTKDMPTPSTWTMTNGQFKDYVGYVSMPGGFPQNYFNVVDQSFVIVTQNGAATVPDTMIQQTVSSDSNGNVTGVSHTIQP